MSDKIYQEHYELQKTAQQHFESLQNIYGTLFPLVSPEGVQLTLQEVLELVVQRLAPPQVQDTPEPQPELVEGNEAEPELPVKRSRLKAQ